MTALEVGPTRVSVRASGTEITTEITAPQPAEHRLRFEVEAADGRRLHTTDGEVSARFYLTNHRMQFTVGVPATAHGAHTLHVFVDGTLESSQPFTLPAE